MYMLFFGLLPLTAQAWDNGAFEAFVQSVEAKWQPDPWSWWSQLFPFPTRNGGGPHPMSTMAMSMVPMPIESMMTWPGMSEVSATSSSTLTTSSDADSTSTATSTQSSTVESGFSTSMSLTVPPSFTTSTTSPSTTSCLHATVCVDGVNACGVAWGGCFDQCSTPSTLIPPCTATPSTLSTGTVRGRGGGGAIIITSSSSTRAR